MNDKDARFSARRVALLMDIRDAHNRLKEALTLGGAPETRTHKNRPAGTREDGGNKPLCNKT